MSTTLIITLALLGIVALFFLMMFIHKVTGHQWFCKNLGWHRDKDVIDRKNNGVSDMGKCIKCSKEVTKDSQGNWY